MVEKLCLELFQFDLAVRTHSKLGIDSGSPHTVLVPKAIKPVNRCVFLWHPFARATRQFLKGGIELVIVILSVFASRELELNDVVNESLVF